MRKYNKLLVTGANGFVGAALKKVLIKKYETVTLCARSSNVVAKDEFKLSPPLSAISDWTDLLRGKDVVVHLAGRAHVMKDISSNPMKEFYEVNVEGTLNLARQAMDSGVKRFIFISSIGVNGSRTTAQPFTESSVPHPHADYAVSKFEAEKKLRELIKKDDMELVIIRPPLVYAAHAPGNFYRLLNLVSKKLPLPFSSVKNIRSMVALENLVSFIEICVEHPAAANQVFLVSDGEEVSTSQIILYLAEGMGYEAKLLPIPVKLMRLSANMVGKKGVFDQLCESLVIDSSKARNLLGWKPVITSSEALIKAGREFKKNLESNKKI